MTACAGDTYSILEAVAGDVDAYSVAGAEAALVTAGDGATYSATGSRDEEAAAGAGAASGDGSCGRHTLDLRPFHILRNGWVDGLLHGALGNALLREDDLGEVLSDVLRLRPGVSAGALGRRGLLSPWRVVLLLVPLPSSALIIFCPRGVAWWLLSAKAMATIIRAYRKYARRRRSLRLLAAPACSAVEAVHTKSIINERSLCKPGQHLRRELDDEDDDDDDGDFFCVSDVVGDRMDSVKTPSRSARKVRYSGRRPGFSCGSHTPNRLLGVWDGAPGFSCGSHTPNHSVLHSQQLSFVRAASAQNLRTQ